MEEPSDVFLVEQSQLGHQEAFSLLIERYQVMSLYIVKRYVMDEEVARELVQEALLQAYLSLQQLCDGSRFKNWFYGITLNVCRSWLRQHKRRDARQRALAEWSEGEEVYPDPEEIILERELQHIISEALLLLSSSNREVARLFYYEDLSIQEIARQKHLSLPAIKNRLYKSREQLRNYLQTQYPELATRSVKRQRKEHKTMIPIKIAMIKQLHRIYRTTVVLSDEREERALPFWYLNLQGGLSALHNSPVEAGRKTIGEPFSIDFMLALIQALGGSVEMIEIDALQGEIAYARLHMRGRDGEPALVNMRLDDALPLAARLATPCTINDELWQRFSVSLAEKGANREQKLEAVAALVQDSSRPGSLLFVTGQQPRNLDFSDSLTGWRVQGSALQEKRFTMQLDPEVMYQGRPVLRAVLQGEDSTSVAGLSRNAILLSHEGFPADTYCGKRMRIVTYCRVQEVREASIEMVVTSPPLQVDSELPYKRLVTRTYLIDDISDWQRQELVVDVPQGASAIVVTLKIVGKGTVWMSGIQYEVVDKNVPLSLFRHDPPLLEWQNFDFQHGLEGWFLGSWPFNINHLRDYSYGTASVDGEGTRCLSIKTAREEPRSLTGLRQEIKSDNYIGKRVRLRGSLKGSGLVEPARLYMKIAQDAYVECSIGGTQEWTPCSMTIFVQENASQIETGLILNGKGQVWLKDLAFEVVG